jgi:predicted CXXCH cytochrome family protein
MLPAEKRQLCGECHDDIVDTAETSAVDHAPSVTGDECLNCHSPHASGNPGILLEPQRDLCLTCHDKAVKSGDSTLMDMKSWLMENEEWHQPIREDDCAGCHQPHGSANFRLLVEPFPSTFYARFDVALYGLCFSCHEEAKVTVERTRTLTAFRDGNRNLHSLHVNKEKRGRTCRACHDLHASPNPLHIRQEVPYGKWLMPINFQKNETGGSCHPGCHEIKSYDRNAKDRRVEQ